MRESIIYSGVQNQEQRFPLGIVKELKKGEFVFSEEDSVFKVYRLKKGMIMLGGSLENQLPSFTHFVHQGEFFGVEGMFNIDQRTNSAQVLSDNVEIEEFNLSTMKHNLDVKSEVVQNYMLQADRVQCTLLRNSTLDLKTRLKAVLKGIGEGFGSKLMNGEVLIRTHLKHRELAFICNATRQSITTQLTQLSKHNYVNIDKNSILLTNNLLTNT